MPRFDKTGPESKGPKTGRAMGDCNASKNTKHNSKWSDWYSGRRQRRRGIWNKTRHAENEETN